MDDSIPVVAAGVVVARSLVGGARGCTKPELELPPFGVELSLPVRGGTFGVLDLRNLPIQVSWIPS